VKNLHNSVKSSTFIRKRISSVKTQRNLILEQKEKDFLSAYNETLSKYQRQGVSIDTCSLCKIVAKQAAPRFYVSPEQALLQYGLYKNGKSNICSEVRRQMYAEIFARVEKLIEISCGIMPRYIAMETVLAQEAPCFYLNEGSSWQFYYKACRNKRMKSKAV
jgi:hypothetical protein